MFNADSIEKAFYNKRVYILPTKDKLYFDIEKLVYDKEILVKRKIDSLIVDKEQNDYLKMFFDWSTICGRFDELEKKDEKEFVKARKEYLEKQLTEKAEAFLLRYKDSRYRAFVQKNFRYVFVLENWGWGYNLGLGSLAPKGELQKYFSSSLAFTIGLDVSYKNLWSEFSFDIASKNKLRTPFVNEGKQWSVDWNYDYTTYRLSLGYVLTESNNFKFIPFVGIGVVNIGINSDDKSKAGGDISIEKAAFQIGFVLDYKMSERKTYYDKNNDKSYIGLRFSVDYNKILDNHPIMSGGMVRLRISYIGFFRSIVRDY